MNIKIIEVIPRFFKTSKQIVLKEGDIELPIFPVKDDKIFIDEIGYRVLQRDIHIAKDVSKQRITLFVEKLY